MSVPRGLVDIPFSEYLASDAIGSHTMQEASRSRDHYERAKAGDDKDTKAMRDGRAIHCMTLTPDIFSHEYVVVDAKSRNTKVAKEAKEASPGREVILAGEAASASRIAQAIWADPIAGPVLTGASWRELSFFWSRDGVKCKGRLDAGRRVGPGIAIIDLKTCVSATAHRAAGGEAPFPSAVLNYGYHIQAAYYSAGIEAATGLPVTSYALIAVEKSTAHVETYLLTEEWLSLGREQYEANWKVITETPQPKTIRTLPMPSWATRTDS